MSCTDTCVTMDCDGRNDFSRESWPRAAKPHQCCECGDAIPVGKKHQYVAGKTDDGFWDYRTCAVCAEIRKTFVCDTYVLTVLWEEIREQMFLSWDDMKAIDCLARLTTLAAVEKMREEYKRYRAEVSDVG